MAKPSRATFDERLNYMVESLRTKISTNEYAPGSYIPSILQLKDEFKLSINSVQKGLDILLQEGLIEKIPRIGIKVLEHKKTILSVGYYATLQDELDLTHIITMFEAKYPTIQINLIPLNFIDYVETTEAYLKNNIVDVVAINHFNYLQFTETHLDLSTLFMPLKANNTNYPYLNDAFTVNSQLFVLPVIFSTVVICYNKDFFEKNNIPSMPTKWTWEQFIKMLDQIESNSSSNLSFYFYPSTWNRWPIFLLQSGHDFSQEKNDLSSELVLNAIDTCYKLIHRQNTFSLLLSTRERTIEQLFLDQVVPIMVTTYYRLNHLKNTNFEFDITALPYVKEPKSLLLPIGFAINQHSNKKELAQLFLEYMNSPEVQLHIRQHTYSIPASKQAAEWKGEEPLYRPKNFNMYNDNYEQLGLLSDINLSLNHLQQLYNIMNIYWSGLIDKEALTEKLAKLTK